MPISVLDLFTIGIGPSSSHSVGPMRAAKQFVDELGASNQLETCERIEVTLFGSLALTGKGHGSDKAVLLGLMGETPDRINVDTIDARIAEVRDSKTLMLQGTHSISFDESTDLVFDRKTKCKVHPNQMQFLAFDDAGNVLAEETCYSVGGGFVLTAAEVEAAKQPSTDQPDPRPYPFHSGAELLGRAKESQLPVSGVVLANELSQRSLDELREGVLKRCKQCRTVWNGAAKTKEPYLVA